MRRNEKKQQFEISFTWGDDKNVVLSCKFKKHYA